MKTIVTKAFLKWHIQIREAQGVLATTTSKVVLEQKSGKTDLHIPAFKSGIQPPLMSQLQPLNQ